MSMLKKVLSRNLWNVRQSCGKKAIPVTISWNRDRILIFLKQQYERGVPKAEELLKLQLWLEVQRKIDMAELSGDISNISNLRILVESFSEFPAHIIRSVLSEHEKGTRRFLKHKAPVTQG